MDHHLVDDGLRKKGSAERQQLHDQRGEQNVAPDLLVFQKVRNEPAEAEMGRAADHIWIENRRPSFGYEEDDAQIALGEFIARQF